MWPQYKKKKKKERKKKERKKIVLLPAAEECVKCSIVEEVVSEQLHYARILRENSP